MTASVSPSSSGAGGQANRITASVTSQGGRSVVKLTYRGETVPLMDSGSLNRWASLGIVDRHKIVLFQDHLNIDGHDLQLADPRLPEELERILNRPPPAHPPAPASSASAHAHALPPASQSEAAYLGSLADSLRVSRDGFEFHISFRTRFGETKTDKLESALEVLQNMRVFKPHISLQKSGIRLVVTRWDGETFVEEPGIENVEHASPEEVEALIRRNLRGSSGSGAGVPRPGRAARPPVIRLEIVKKLHDARFHMVYHRQDGNTEDGPVLIRANMAKLAADRVFRPGVSVSLTTLNDCLIIARQQKASGEGVVEEERLPLVTQEDAKRAEALLNECLNPAMEPDAISASLPEPAPPPPEAELAIAPAAPEAVETAESPLEATASESGVGPAGHPAPKSAVNPESSVPAAQAVPESPPPEAEAKPAPRNWMSQALESSGHLPMDEINRAVFDSLQARFNSPVFTNDHDFPAFALERPGGDGQAVTLEFVLTPHYLLCNYPFGYVRFGPETRVFLTRLDDYAVFPQPALRGVVQLASGGIAFVVSDEFARFLAMHTDRSYKARFGDVLLGVGQAGPGHELIWPLTREERLFQMLGATAQSYALPVTHDTVVLDPKAQEFIGFKTAPGHGMEFRDGEDYVRFTPVDVEFKDDAEIGRFSGEGVLLGWALDREGRVCALYRQASGFIPPEHPKLLRYIPEPGREREEEGLNILAEVS